MNTEPVSKFPECGAMLPPNAPGGLCPNCLMALNLKTETAFSGEQTAAQAPLPPATKSRRIFLSSMGSEELKQVVSRKDGMTIELTDAGAREGALYVFYPSPLRLIAAQGCDVAIEPEPDNVRKLKVSARRRGRPQNIQIAICR